MSLRDRIEQLDARERRLLTLLGATFAALIVLGVPVGVTTLLAGQQSENDKLRDSIDSIQESRGALQKRDSAKKALLSRYAQPAPPLAAFLGGLAESNGIDIPETQDRSNVAHGKKFEERQTKITLSKVHLLNLVKFMEGIVQSPHPVQISRLEIRKRGAEPDSYDAELVVSAFDRKSEKSAGKSEEKLKDGAAGSASPKNEGPL